MLMLLSSHMTVGLRWCCVFLKSWFLSHSAYEDRTPLNIMAWTSEKWVRCLWISLSGSSGLPKSRSASLLRSLNVRVLTLHFATDARSFVRIFCSANPKIFMLRYHFLFVLFFPLNHWYDEQDNEASLTASEHLQLLLNLAT